MFKNILKGSHENTYPWWSSGDFLWIFLSFTTWTVSKYGFFSGLCFRVFQVNSARIQENTDKKKLCIWTFFMQCFTKLFWQTTSGQLLLNSVRTLWILQKFPEQFFYKNLRATASVWISINGSYASAYVFIQWRYAVVWNARFHHQITWILSNIWLMSNCLRRFILIVNGWLLISYDRVKRGFYL